MSILIASVQIGYRFDGVNHHHAANGKKGIGSKYTVGFCVFRDFIQPGRKYQRGRYIYLVALGSGDVFMGRDDFYFGLEHEQKQGF